MKKIVVNLLSLAMVAGSLSACTNSSSTIDDSNDPYYHAWYDVYGNYCGTGYPAPGCNFFSDGYKITIWEDPYYTNSTMLTFRDWEYRDSYGDYQRYRGYAWQGPSGIIYDEYGNALNEIDQDSAQTADVIGQAATREIQVSQAVGKALAQKYALNEEKGVMISKTLQDWAKLGKGRARTNGDVAEYAQRLYGVDASKAKSAIAQSLASQSQKPMDDLNVDVAAYWGTSPEVSKKILKSWYKQEVSTYGIK